MKSNVKKKTRASVFFNRCGIRCKVLFHKIGVAIVNFFRRMRAKIKATNARVKEVLTQGNGKVSASMLIMGLGQLLYKQWIKGCLFLARSEEHTSELQSPA